MIKLGITGGIGSGKSIVCKIFESLGYPIYNADDRAKWLVENDSDLKKNIILILGSESYIEDKYNRSFVSKTVFQNPDLLIKLNELIHPKVGNDFDKWASENSNSKIIVKEAALIFESDSYKNLDKIITVIAPIEDRIDNILKRDTFRTKEEILKIINNQLSDKEKIDKSDFVIYNNSNELILPQILNIINQLSKI